MSENRPVLEATHTSNHLNEDTRTLLYASGLLVTFNSKNLTELYEVAQKMYQLLAAISPCGSYELHTSFDEDSKCWTGVLEEIY